MEGARAWPFDEDPAKSSLVYVAASSHLMSERASPAGLLRGARGVGFDLAEQPDEAGVRWSSVCARVRMEDEQGAERVEGVGVKLAAWLGRAAQEKNSPESCRKALGLACPERKGSEVTLSVKVNSKDFATLLGGPPPCQSPNEGEACPAGSGEPQKPATTPGNPRAVPQPPANNAVGTQRPRR